MNEHEKALAAIDKRWHQNSDILGMRLMRGALNQADYANPGERSDAEHRERIEVMMSRYGIWANTAAHRLQRVVNALQPGKADVEALEELRRISESLHAFVAIQQHFTDTPITDGAED